MTEMLDIPNRRLLGVRFLQLPLIHPRGLRSASRPQ